MALTLTRIHDECYNPLQSIAYDYKLPQTAIPVLFKKVDMAGTRERCFTINTVHAAVGVMFDRIKESLGRRRDQAVSVGR